MNDQREEGRIWGTIYLKGRGIGKGAHKTQTKTWQEDVGTGAKRGESLKSLERFKIVKCGRRSS